MAARVAASGNVDGNVDGNGEGMRMGGVVAKQKASMPSFREEKKKVDDGRGKPY